MARSTSTSPALTSFAARIIMYQSSFYRHSYRHSGTGPGAPARAVLSVPSASCKHSPSVAQPDCTQDSTYQHALPRAPRRGRSRWPCASVRTHVHEPPAHQSAPLALSSLRLANNCHVTNPVYPMRQNFLLARTGRGSGPAAAGPIAARSHTGLSGIIAHMHIGIYRNE